VEVPQVYGSEVLLSAYLASSSSAGSWAARQLMGSNGGGSGVLKTICSGLDAGSATPRRATGLNTLNGFQGQSPSRASTRLAGRRPSQSQGQARIYNPLHSRDHI